MSKALNYLYTSKITESEQLNINFNYLTKFMTGSITSMSNITK